MTIKRKRESGGLPPADSHLSDIELIEKYALSSPRIEVVPGVRRRIVRGRRSKYDAKEWVCSCAHVNQPIRRIFFDIPKFTCANCDKPIPEHYEFEFSLGNVQINGACPVGNVKNQEQRPHCMIYSLSTSAEVTSRVRSILLDEVVDEGPLICMRTFMKKLKMKLNLPAAVDIEYRIPETRDEAFHMLEILKDGVKTQNVSNRVKISGYVEIPMDFEAICQQLSSGNPMWTSIRTGKRFSQLKPNEIYVPPRKNEIVEGKSSGLHAILLLGGAMCKGVACYKFINTHDEDFCKLNYQKRKDNITGGFGTVIAMAFWRDLLSSSESDCKNELANYYNKVQGWVINFVKEAKTQAGGEDFL